MRRFRSRSRDEDERHAAVHCSNPLHEREAVEVRHVVITDLTVDGLVLEQVQDLPPASRSDHRESVVRGLEPGSSLPEVRDLFERYHYTLICVDDIEAFSVVKAEYRAREHPPPVRDELEPTGLQCLHHARAAGRQAGPRGGGDQSRRHRFGPRNLGGGIGGTTIVPLNCTG